MVPVQGLIVNYQADVLVEVAFVQGCGSLCKDV